MGELTARACDPQTSVEAAMSVDKEAYHRHILEVLRRYPGQGFIIDEIAEMTGIDRQTLSPRLVELERKSKLCRWQIGVSNTGRPIYESRRGKAGRAQQMWFSGFC